MAASLDLETLIRPVSTMLLDLLHHFKGLPAPPTLELLQHLEDLPGSPQLEDAPPLQHHCQSPLLPTPTTEGMEAQVIGKLILDAKLDNNKPLVNETSHLYTLTDTHITPRQSTNPRHNSNNTKPMDSPAHDTPNNHSCIDKANHKSGSVEDNEDKEPRNAIAPQRKSTFDKPEITLITDKLPDTAPDNPSNNKFLTYYPFRRPSNLTDDLLESTHAPSDDYNTKETHEKESHPLFALDLHEANADDSSMNPENPKQTNSSKIEHTDLKEEEPAVDEENPNPDESSLDDLIEPTHAPVTLDLHETNADDSSLKPEKPKYTNSSNTELIDLKEEEPAVDSKNPNPVKSSLETQKHSKSCKTEYTGNLTEDDPPNETETPYPNEAKESKHNLIKNVDPPDKDDESPSSPPKTNKSKGLTDPLNEDEVSTQNPLDKPELSEENDDNPLNPLMTNESASLTDPLQEAPNSVESTNRSIPPHIYISVAHQSG